MNVTLCDCLEKVRFRVHKIASGVPSKTLCGIDTAGHRYWPTRRDVTCDICKLGALDPSPDMGTAKPLPERELVGT